MSSVLWSTRRIVSIEEAQRQHIAQPDKRPPTAPKGAIRVAASYLIKATAGPKRYYTVPMAMGRRKRDRQPAMWVTTTDLSTASSHPFYRRLSQLLRETRFDEFAEAQCACLTLMGAAFAATEGRKWHPAASGPGSSSEVA